MDTALSCPPSRHRCLRLTTLARCAGCIRWFELTHSYRSHIHMPHTRSSSTLLAGVKHLDKDLETQAGAACSAVPVSQGVRACETATSQHACLFIRRRHMRARHACTIRGGAGGGRGGRGVKYRMLHIPGILDCTYHLHVSCLCAQGSSIAEYLDYSP